VKRDNTLHSIELMQPLTYFNYQCTSLIREHLFFVPNC
jgi:hypothetical protein